jgi:putative oxidoreductase
MTSDTRNRFLTIAITGLRIAAATAFFTHGAQKLFGWFGGFGPNGGTAPLMSQFGVAGVLETFGGLCLVLGVFTRPIAFLLSGEMAVAYFWMHVGGSGKLWWWENGGEVVMLYSFIWLFFSAWGAGPVSLDAMRQRRATGADVFRGPASPRSEELASHDAREPSMR